MMPNISLPTRPSQPELSWGGMAARVVLELIAADAVDSKSCAIMMAVETSDAMAADDSVGNGRASCRAAIAGS